MNPNITKLIDQYLSGELGAEDRQAFEAKMAEHPDLQKEVALQQSVYDAAKRSVVRQQVRKTGKRYHLGRWLKMTGLGLGIVIVAVAATVYSASNEDGNPTEEEQVPSDLQKQLDQHLQLDQLDAQYFSISASGEVVLSEDGVLLSVPHHAFLKDGKPYDGESILQFQEALNGGDIVKAGLSTMSGDRLLETQGMMALQAYTPDGELLDFNPKVGVYVQVPVDAYKSKMQLFDGIKMPDGTIDWQNPVPLEKIPVPLDMTELNFYPEGYEDFLDEQKWKRSKKSRDSLYLSFEQFNRIEREVVKVISIPQNEAVGDSTYNSHSGDAAMDVAQWYIYPSKVLGFWNQKFNQTNLATREFERRMRVIHTTCSNTVLEKYTKHLDRPLSEIDAEIAAMGYTEFEVFASEQVGRVTVSNAHLEQLKKFYSDGVHRLKNQAKRDSEKERKRQKAMDDHMTEERLKEGGRTASRNGQNLLEEFTFNLENVYQQLGKTVGFTIGTGGGQASAIKNIDRYVMEATIARQSATITDPETGKTADITYNDFRFEVPQANKYLKLYAYLFPHQLNSYQRINGNNGRFDYPLNDAIVYDLAVVGLTKDGFEYYQKQTFKSGELGQINMQPIGETKLEASIQQLNAGRISKPMAIGDELQWLFTERGYYKELQQRMEMAVFREQVACVLFPCYEGGQIDDSSTATNREK